VSSNRLAAANRFMAARASVQARLHGASGLPVAVRLSFDESVTTRLDASSRPGDSALALAPVKPRCGCHQTGVSHAIETRLILDATTAAASVVQARAQKYDGRGCGAFVTLCIGQEGATAGAAPGMPSQQLTQWAADLGVGLLDVPTDLSKTY
jgi:uncharacterized protein YceK